MKQQPSSAKSNRPRLFCIHGNLQPPEVWQPFADAFYTTDQQGHASPLPITEENLWSAVWDTIDEWVDDFQQRIHADCCSPAGFLLGYSMGGRLALRAALRAPNKWYGIILVAAHPGFAAANDQQQRRERDDEWARRFEEMPWNNVVDDWNRQPVFSGRANPWPPTESELSRAGIARMLRIFSNGNTPEITPALASLAAPPILYISGREDSKYCRIGKALAATCPVITHTIIDGAAHRVPWEAPEAFKQGVQQFIDRVYAY